MPQGPPPPNVYVTAPEGEALEALRTALASAREGRGQLLLWPGPAGCGKTFMLDRAEHLAIDECGVAPGAVFRDFFKPAPQRPRGFGKWSDVAESLVKDLHELTESTLPFKNTIIKVLRIAVDRFGPELLQPVRARILDGKLSGLPDLLQTIATVTDAPAILLLDDIDHADASGNWMPPILRDIHSLARVGDARFVMVVTMGMRKGVWTMLHDEAAWCRDWVVNKALRPFEPADVDDLVRATYPPDGLPATVVADVARSTGGVPLLVVQELAMMRQVGDLTAQDGRWIYAPREIDFTDFDRYDRGASQTDSAQAFIRGWYDRMAQERKWPAVVDDVLAAAALEGTVFTLEAVHAFLLATLPPEALPTEWTDFEAFAAWVDDTLVEEASEDRWDEGHDGEVRESGDTSHALTAGTLPLSDETYGVGASGISRYAFAIPAVREYFFGQAAGRRLDREIVRVRFATYANCLTAYARESSVITCRVAELFEAAGEEAKAVEWGGRVGSGHDLEQIDRIIESLSLLPSSPALASHIAQLALGAVEIGWWTEPLEKTLERCEAALLHANRAERRDLINTSAYKRTLCLIGVGRQSEALRLANEALATRPEGRFLHARAAVYRNLGQWAEAERDLRVMLALIERELRADLAFTLAPDAISAANVDHWQRHTLIEWAEIASELVSVLDERGFDTNLGSARSLIERAIAVLMVFLPSNHPSLLKAHEALAHVMARSGDLDGAKAMLKSLLRDRDPATEATSPYPLALQQRLAELSRKSGDWEAAQREYELLLQGAAHLHGPWRPQTLHIRICLADVLRRRRNIAACLDQLAAVAEQAECAPDRDDVPMLIVRRALADCYWQAGEPSIATEVLTRVLDASVRLRPLDERFIERVREDLERFATASDPDAPSVFLD